MDETALENEIRSFLRSHHVMSLATVAEGAAHAVSLMFAAADFSIYWISDPHARHSTAIERHPQVAATVAPDYADFRRIRGLQIAGRARRLNEAAEAARARELLRERFPFLRGPGGMAAELRAALDRAAYYALDSETITLIDNSKGFGNKRLLRIAR